MDKLILLIITIPSFSGLLNKFYFSIHDDQHIARLFLLDRGIQQGSFYPRWVDWLGFGFGYPLYNFYPPLIYYISEAFYLLGFSFIWSIKILIILGFILAAFGMYLYLKSLIGKKAALLGATVYTYFFYHAVAVYVRGALAEFFAMSLIPFILLGVDRLAKDQNIKNLLLFGFFYALIILTQPLIALPLTIFIGLLFIFYYLFICGRRKNTFLIYFTVAFILGLSLSSFFWLPSITEKKYTLVDNILTQELASYKIHYVFPQQLWYSPWGYGGSTPGTNDGMTFQLGKVNILLIATAIALAFLYWKKIGKINNYLKYYLLFLFLLIFSLFMTTPWSSFIWDRVDYLWYLQFPWRFLTFTTFFTGAVAAYVIFFTERLFINKKINFARLFTAGLCLLVVFKYYSYFRPQHYIRTTDKERTSFEEIAWRISSTSYEFVPKEVKTKKSAYNTTVLDISKYQLTNNPFTVVSGEGEVNVVYNFMESKKFLIEAMSPLTLRINTYTFPGWTVMIDGEPALINDSNSFKLITVTIPEGQHTVEAVFKDTPIRKIGNAVSLFAWLLFISLLLKSRSTSAVRHNGRT